MGCAHRPPSATADYTEDGTRRTQEGPYLGRMSEPLLDLSPAARSGVWLIVDFFTDPDRAEEARDLFTQHVKDGRNDQGNLCFFVLKDEREPGRFTSTECWEDEAALANHDAQPHHPVFLARLKELQTREKEVRFLGFVATGD